jgi:hypothetical protein
MAFLAGSHLKLCGSNNNFEIYPDALKKGMRDALSISHKPGKIYTKTE